MKNRKVRGLKNNLEILSQDPWERKGLKRSEKPVLVLGLDLPSIPTPKAPFLDSAAERRGPPKKIVREKNIPGQLFLPA